ncbi:MAG: Crp/Fnr family transcriptional regulator [Crocinitomicaceae bacterium]|jgi:CRP/FNR family transcriptional regulator|nr:Crp/Fnr family transcriptional regulator [Crocinitomicaceae bacterium]MCF8433434.1 Crp/Fnr family transcriptional regulator [Crocinitomicaceae bacterium]
MLDKSHKHVSCATCQARKKSLFSANFDENLSHLEEHKSCSYFKKNQPLFIEGSFPRGVYCLNQGKVKVFARGDEGKEQIIHIAKEGEIIGFRAMFSGDMYKVSATALEDANICFISKDDFLDMIDTNPTLRNGIMRELSKELGDRAVFITNMAQKSVRERLAAALIILDDVYSGEQINLTREDLANFVGTATETLIRLLKDLKEEGVIDIHTRKLEIIDKDKLMKIAGGR